MSLFSPRPAQTLALLIAINLFNYIDRQVLAAVEPEIRSTFFSPDDPDAKFKTGALATAFLVTYMLMAPVFGFLADKFSRWTLVGFSVALWSLASGWSGLAGSFAILIITRIFVGIGEAGYGPAAPTMISDAYPVEKRGQVLSWFYLAIPVGSALGYVLGGVLASHYGWRTAFYAVAPPGLLLAALCFFLRDQRTAKPARVQDLSGPSAQDRAQVPVPRFATAASGLSATLGVYREILRIPSFRYNTAAMAAMTFAIGGIAFWIPSYIYESRGAEFPPHPKLLGHINQIFGVLTALGGLCGTLAGGWLGDVVRRRYASAYFLVSGGAMFLAFPATVGFLYAPFPAAWVFLFCAVFLLFFNTGPANAALANTTPPHIRASAFALNIFLIHALGDAISPPLIGWIAGWSSMNTAFLIVSGVMVLASVFWLLGARGLARDVAAVEKAA